MITPSSVHSSISDTGLIIAILGPSGSGKSSFIRQLVEEKDSVPVGHGVTPMTTSFVEYSVQIGGEMMTVVDSPGMDATDSIFDQLVNWLSEKYGSRTLDGIILFQPVTTNRLTNSLNYQSSLLCGFDKVLGCMRGETHPFYRVVLATTMWTNGPGEEHWKEVSRAEGLQAEYWNILRAKGAVVKEYNNSPECAKEFVRFILTAQHPEVKPRVSIADCMVIAVIGPAGAGKSSFIGSLVEDFSLVGNMTQTYTEEVAAYEVEVNDEKVILLDTPGLYTTGDLERTFKMISKWLALQAKNSKRSRVYLDGIIFVRRISDDAVGRGIDQSALMKQFNKLLGGLKYIQDEKDRDAYRRVILVTTMWDKLRQDEGLRREHLIRLQNWNIMHAAGAAMMRFDRTTECARGILQVIIEEKKSGDPTYQYRNIMRSLADITSEMRLHEGKFLAELQLLRQEQLSLGGSRADSEEHWERE